MRGFVNLETTYKVAFDPPSPIGKLCMDMRLESQEPEAIMVRIQHPIPSKDSINS